jgi:hypothetical protein
MATENGVAHEPLDAAKPSSSSILQIAKALSQAQRDVTDVKRTQTGFMPTKSGGYDYKYAGLDEVHKATRAPQAANGLSLFTPFETDAARLLSLRVFLLHESGEWLNYGLYPLGSFSTHQNLGGAVTYARRYIEGVIYKVSPQDDDDARSASEEQKRKQQKRAAQSGGDENPWRKPKTDPFDESKRNPNTALKTAQAAMYPTPEKQTTEFRPPADWPETAIHDLKAWIDGFSTTAQFKIALGLFLNEHSISDNLADWEPILRHFAATYKRKARGIATKELTAVIKAAIDKLDYDKEAARMLNQDVEGQENINQEQEAAT